ncbi:basic helix-loop-helix (bHLH) DNA-binding superfamily protein [Actinidia rufa]|uniref:Basic helix-loop-helix (BHLH) DNA-binding superfamily protein n=1 Tax=Actinidia rufa TaxID=165716 RepID=A0A7J0FUB3_9ERIC|nr:basic helix-loop-helix (bHLH) DNA-binding superfamily protein [Actinidia rufa]
MEFISSMEFASSVVPCDEIDELLQLSSAPFQQHRIQEDTLLVTPSLYNGDVTSKPDNSRRRKSSVTQDDTPLDYKSKKVIHRDGERQRRQEMAALNRSLRSLMPLEYLKGRRSMSDNMHEAVKYIRHLQKRVEELREKRDELTNTSDQVTENGGSKCLASCVQESTVAVETSRTGVRVTGSIPLSRGVSVSIMLDLLLREGLVVVSCVSTNLEERLILSIESEVLVVDSLNAGVTARNPVDDGRSINLSELQKKLTDLMG